MCSALLECQYIVGIISCRLLSEGALRENLADVPRGSLFRFESASGLGWLVAFDLFHYYDSVMVIDEDFGELLSILLRKAYMKLLRVCLHPVQI